MAELQVTRYDDGGWCEQQYVDGKLHGTWTVFNPDGQKKWERQYKNGYQDGFSREWDKFGRLIEEQSYHLGQLHGLWRKWDEQGREKVIGNFLLGDEVGRLETATNPEFNALIRPHYRLEPADFAAHIDSLLPTLARKSIRLKGTSLWPDLTVHDSFWNYVNLLGEGEEWPHFQGQPLFPILQINCDELALPGNPLAQFSFITLFSIDEDAPNRLGEDIVLRAYRREDEMRLVEPPSELLGSPQRMSLADSIVSFPDRNDLPPGLKIYLEESGDNRHVLDQDEKLKSRVAGWPGWLQYGGISGHGTFAFQVDSLDVENWECGDSSIHYFFRDKNGEFYWQQEMC